MATQRNATVIILFSFSQNFCKNDRTLAPSSEPDTVGTPYCRSAVVFVEIFSSRQPKPTNATPLLTA